MRISATRGSWSLAADSDWVDGFSLGVDEPEVLLGAGAGVSTHQLRAVIELRRSGGGISPRALLGAEFVGGGHQLRATVPSDGPIRRDGARRPALLGSDLLPGLPDEFRSAVLAGIRRGVGVLPAGLVRVRQSGYDPVDSSEYAFRNAASLLVSVLEARLQGRELSVGLLREWSEAI